MKVYEEWFSAPSTSNSRKTLEAIEVDNQTVRDMRSGVRGLNLGLFTLRFPGRAWR
jgi:hypothetical protein